MKKQNSKNEQKLKKMDTCTSATRFDDAIMALNNDIDSLIEKHKSLNSGNEGFADGLRHAKELINSRLSK